MLVFTDINNMHMHLNVKHTYTTQPNNDEKMQSYLKYLDEVGTSVSRLESFSALHNTLKSWYTRSIQNAEDEIKANL